LISSDCSGAAGAEHETVGQNPQLKCKPETH
jgi:hypothetical protein